LVTFVVPFLVIPLFLVSMFSVLEKCRTRSLKKILRALQNFIGDEY